MAATDGRPILSFPSSEAWEHWLEEHHASSEGLWLKIAKKQSEAASVTYAEALEAALCYGWIDGQKETFDGEYWLQRFTPRSPRSGWSRINREKAEGLIGAGRMKEAGLRQVERAKADGRWASAYASQRTAVIPEDLQRALEANAPAREFFQRLDSANRYAILYRLENAKKAETRARRLEQYVAMLERGETLHPPRGRAS